MIRGKVETEREVVPKRIVFGKSPFIRVNGKLVNRQDPKRPVVIRKFSDLVARKKSEE